MSYRIGVLVIGSLFWDKSDPRVSWRNHRLDIDHGVNVSLPIRYGRISGKRNNTYTMVFSSLCYRKEYSGGKAYILPFLNSVKTFEDVHVEAQELWNAENNEKRNSISANWGAVGLFSNLERKGLDLITDEWKSFYIRKENKAKITCSKTELSPISENGILQIRWPQVINSCKPVDFDFLLATVTSATLTTTSKYHNSFEISNAWINDTKEKGNYFIKNVLNGIYTFQDAKIWLNIKNSNASWLKQMTDHEVDQIDKILLA